jgi:TPR repeat protein
MWLEKSVQGGYRPAADELADHYLSLKDYDVALELYLYGDYGLVSEDLKKIYELQSPELFTKEIDYANIDTISAFDIAAMYYYGIRSEQNEKLSKEIQFKLFEISADGGYPTAMYFLGKCYENGIGVKKDRSKALELYNQVIESGYAYNISSDMERVSK